MPLFRPVAPLLVLTVLAACATTEPGWTGEGAVPFDTALAQCRDDVANIPVQATREAKLAECMAAKGWTRE